MILKIYFGHYDFSVTVSFKLLRFFIEKFSEDIKDIATSIKNEFNIDVNVQDFIEEFCEKFEKNILERTK